VAPPAPGWIRGVADRRGSEFICKGGGTRAHLGTRVKAAPGDFYAADSSWSEQAIGGGAFSPIG
jgi:hypothetical protein